LAGIEIEYYVVKLDSDRITPENAGFTPVPPDVSVFERGYQYLSEVRLDSVGDTIEAIRDALWEVGLPPRAMEDEWGPGQLEFNFAPIGALAAADAVVLFRSAVKQVPAPRPARELHVPAGPAELLLLRLAPAPVADLTRGRRQRLCQPGRVPVRPGPPVCRRAARARAADDAVLHPHRERLQALPPVLLRAGPGVLGGGEPRRPGQGPGLARRRQQPRRDADRRARGQPVSLPGRQHRRRAGRNPARAGSAAPRRSRPLRRGGAPAAHVPGPRGQRARRRRVLPQGVR